MTVIHNKFIDPVTLTEYQWPINHSEEDEAGPERSIEHTAPTGTQSGQGGSGGAVGLVRQEGDVTPVVWNLRGKIFDPAQHAQFITWFERCSRRTIFWSDPAGDVYEVRIVSYKPKRRGVARNPHYPDVPWIWEYSMLIEVVDAITGPWVGATQ